MYTHENWKRLKKDLGLKNKDIAEIVGLTLDSVKNQTQPSKDLPTWARGMIYVYEQLNAVKSMEFDAKARIDFIKNQALNVDDIEKLSKTLYSVQDTKASDIVEQERIDGIMNQPIPLKKSITLDCGCAMRSNIFFKSPTCKLPKEEHKF